jgi:hypothetical protein
MLAPSRLLDRSRNVASLLLVPGNAVPSNRVRNQHSHTSGETYYDVLGVPRTSSAEAIKTAFRTVRLHADLPSCKTPINELSEY